MQKEQLEFGQGHFVGSIMKDQTFFELPVREQARILGWADSCPVVTELTDPANQDPNRGSENMLHRYGQLNFWFGEVVRTAEERNPGLYSKLVTFIPRLPGEPAGKYEPESVPRSHANQISPMGALAGYATPRIIVEQINDVTEGEPASPAENMVVALHHLEAAVIMAQTPIEMLVRFGERLVGEGLPPTKVLKHALSQGWLEEHNAYSMVAEFKKVMAAKAPRLQHFYENLSTEEKRQLKLV